MANAADNPEQVQCTELCERLHNIGAHNGKLPSSGVLADALGIDESGYPLGTLDELRKRDKCPVCRIISAACGKARLETVDKGHGGQEPVRVALFPREHCLRLSHPSLSATRIMFITEGLDKLEPELGPYAARIVGGQPISTSQVRSWLQRCEEIHGNKCCHIPFDLSSQEFETRNFGEEKTSNFRLVDLKDNCIRRMPLDTRYVALSYVRGLISTFQLHSGNHKQLQTPRSLDSVISELPRTFTDAVDFARSLGERYLWVDMLCLIQDDQRDIKIGIGMMNSIYKGSYFTIIAASGADAQAGLPGVRHGSRQPSQDIAQLNSKMRMVVTYSLDWHLRDTVYNQRGWKFQELVLPRRTVVFVNDQVYFRCMEADWCEETAAELLPDWTDADNSSVDRLPTSEAGNLEAWSTYQTLCEEYSSRTLRHDGDAIRALSGILRPLSAGLSSYLTEGLPAYYLDAAFLFVSSNGRLRRRSGFASYSWAGWAGQITWPRETYHWPDDTREGSENLFNWLRTKTFIPWEVWKRCGVMNETECVDGYDEPCRMQRLADRYSHVLDEKVVANLRRPQSLQGFPLAFFATHRSGFPRPCFRHGMSYSAQGGSGGLYYLDQINSQAEFDNTASEIIDSLAWLYLDPWLGQRRYAIGQLERKQSGGPTTCARDEDEIDFEFREGPAREIKNVIGDEDGDAVDGRVECVEKLNKKLRKSSDGPVPEVPSFPRYHLLCSRTLSIRLVAGHLPASDPERQSASINGKDRDSPSQGVQGAPLLSPAGEVVGSLHLDDVSSYTPGQEVECLILSYSYQPIAGSALPIVPKIRGNLDEWDLFWIMFVVEENGVYERRGVGQVLDSALANSCAPGPEFKPILLGLKKVSVVHLHLVQHSSHETTPPFATMCREVIAIAQCAPLKPPNLTFNCGRLHLVAQQRFTCVGARGSCVCFFGTCGSVEKVTGTGAIDFLNIPKIRCASCTDCEDNVGDRRSGREILESVLLQRPAIDQSDSLFCEKNDALLRALWGKKSSCPFHAEISSTAAESAAAQPVADEPTAARHSEIAEHQDAQPSFESAVQATAEVPQPENDTSSDSWTAPTSVPGSPAKQDQPCTPSFDSDIRNGLERVVGLETSRWATKPPELLAQKPVVYHAPPLNFTPDPNNVTKVRDATQKIASIKSFLSGRIAV
ncbi:hypothetical protein FZEAL_7273 [Fusarium zealandicum]|uniref:Heterokaryon incompatibility domain-containing protein n=1 Tax=Fusarium zealandicum TaxID=1053134 RepID=A0A8H4XI12_9HYPO|nr:hypothetical protein FZEAL_7273 [Fusarium zealandicum]